MDGYSSLFMSGFKNQAVPRTPPRFPTKEHKNGHSSLEPPLVLATNITPLRRKAHRKRKSSISQEINPIAGLKSPTRKAGAALMSPIVEKRFLDFNTSSFAGAMNLFRRTKVKPPQKPLPTMPLPPAPINASSPPTTPKRATSALPPSSPIIPDSAVQPAKNSSSLRKRSMDRLPKLRVKTSGIFGSRGGPLSASFNLNARPPSRAPSPGLLSPELVYSISATSSSNMSASTLHTPLTAPVSYIDWGMADLKEENEDSREIDIEMDL